MAKLKIGIKILFLIYYKKFQHAENHKKLINEYLFTHQWA